MLWRTLTNAVLEKVLRIRPTARIHVQNAGTTAPTVITPTELKKLSGLTASTSELNTMTGITATVAELNRVVPTGRVVATTATVLALTVTQHGDRVVLVNTNSTVANTLTLPVASGSGSKFTVVNGIAQTQGSIVVAANGTDIIKGLAIVANTTVTQNTEAFLTSTISDTITLNRTTQGGAGPGDIVEAWDIAANTWSVQVRSGSVGTAATPFSGT